MNLCLRNAANLRRERIHCYAPQAAFKFLEWRVALRTVLFHVMFHPAAVRQAHAYTTLSVHTEDTIARCVLCLLPSEDVQLKHRMDGCTASLPSYVVYPRRVFQSWAGVLSFPLHKLRNTAFFSNRVMTVLATTIN